MPAGGMANRIFPRLPCRRRFDEHARPRQQARPAVRAGVQKQRNFPCRSFKPTVSRVSARRCSGPPARRRRKPSAVAVGCVNANLAGHDSHGVIAIPTYIDRIKAGHIVPGAKWTIVRESPTTTVIDGHWGFGFHVNAKAMALTIEKAKTANVAACTVFRQSHVGRLAAYPMMAMRAGMIGIAAADSGRSPKHVAPFGGREARLGTNPISIAVPSDLEAPFYLDMATSAVAAGKIALSVARGEQIPQGWIIDAEGRHTTDPTQYRKGGALLPLGGSEGYKEAVWPPWSRCCAACSRAWALASSRPAATTTDASWRCSMSPRSARLKDFEKEVGEFARYLKSTPPSKAPPACSIPARSNISANSSAGATASRSRTPPGTN